METVTPPGPERILRLNPHVVRSALVAALGGLLFGFDTAVIAGTTRALVETYALSATALGITVSSALWGTVLGSIDVVSDRPAPEMPPALKPICCTRRALNPS